MNEKLPTRLGISPLIDAIFEIRFEAEAPLSSILTGLIFSGLSCEKVEKLPHAEIPESIRKSDPNLKYIILHNLAWGNLTIGIGDNSITLVPRYPYPGWPVFKERIETLIDFLRKLPLIKRVERFSLKYVNILEFKHHSNIFDSLSINFSLSNRQISEKTINMRAEIPRPSGVHIVNIIGHAIATLPSNIRFEGILVEIDSIMQLSGSSLADGISEIKDQLKPLHQDNKTLFFDLLTKQCLIEMEPVYE